MYAGKDESLTYAQGSFRYHRFYEMHRVVTSPSPKPLYDEKMLCNTTDITATSQFISQKCFLEKSQTATFGI